MDQELFYRRNRIRKILICSLAAIVVGGVMGSLIMEQNRVHEKLTAQEGIWTQESSEVSAHLAEERAQSDEKQEEKEKEQQVQGAAGGDKTGETVAQ